MARRNSIIGVVILGSRNANDVLISNSQDTFGIGRLSNVIWRHYFMRTFWTTEVLFRGPRSDKMNVFYDTAKQITRRQADEDETTASKLNKQHNQSNRATEGATFKVRSPCVLELLLLLPLLFLALKSGRCSRRESSLRFRFASDRIQHEMGALFLPCCIIT
jgi:hypothetical protein